MLLKIITVVFLLGLTPFVQAETKVFQKGVASWYGGKFHGRKTASGKIFNTYKMTAAHKTLPFGTKVEVTNLATGKKVMVEITDRGPFVKDRIIDLSKESAKRLGIMKSGTQEVSLSIVQDNN